MENSKSHDFEGLIEFLVQELAINDWNKGLSVAELLGRIETFYDNQEQTRSDKQELAADEDDGDEPLTPTSEFDGWERPIIDRDFKVNVWDTLTARDDIIVGEGIVLSLDEVEALPIKEPVDNVIDPALIPQDLAESKTEAPGIEYQPRIHVGQSRLWLVLTGHDVDKTKLPFSEWQLLLAIAAAGKNGVLQAEARNRTGQDKRSVPRRTDFLAQKGYIEKKQVLAFNQKTSLLTHKIFLNQKSVQPDIPNPSILPASVLTQDLKPVPGHEHWTGLFVDTEMVARTAVAIIRAWGVIRRTHILAKMHIKDLRLRKTLERTLRKLFELKVCKRVSALLPDNPKIFKDCVKFLRDPMEEEWSHFKKKLTSQGFKNRPSRAKPKSEHKPRKRKRTKSKTDKYAVDDLSEDAFDDVEAEDSENSGREFFDEEDEELYDASEKPTLMTTTKESVEDIIEEAIETNPGDEGISEEDLLAEVGSLSAEGLLVLFAPFDISSASPSDIRRIRIVREPIEKAGREIYQYYVLASFERRVSNGESSWDGTFVLRHPGTPTSSIKVDGKMTKSLSAPTIASQSVISSRNPVGANTPKAKLHETEVAMSSLNGEGSSRLLQPSISVRSVSEITPSGTPSLSQPETPKRPRGRPRKIGPVNKPKRDIKGVTFTSDDQLQREAGVPGVYFDLPDFQVHPDRANLPPGSVPRGRKPKRFMVMIKSKKIKTLNLAPKLPNPQSTGIEAAMPATSVVPSYDKQDGQPASTLTVPKDNGQNLVGSSSGDSSDSAGKQSASAISTYTSPYQDVTAIPSIPALVHNNSQAKSVTDEGCGIRASSKPLSYVSPYTSTKPQAYNSPYVRSSEATTPVFAPQSPTLKASQLGPKPGTPQYQSPYTTISKPTDASSTSLLEAQPSPVLQPPLSSQPTQTKPYKSPYTKSIPSPTLPSAAASPAISDHQELANSQLVAEIEAAAQNAAIDAHEATVADGQGEMDVDTNVPANMNDNNETLDTDIATGRDDTDEPMHISVSREEVPGHLHLSDDGTQLEFLPLDAENLVSKMAIEISKIPAIPVVEIETCELLVLTSESQEESNEVEDVKEIKFCFDPTFTEATQNFVAKIATVMNKKEAKKKVPLPPWAYPVPDGGPKPFKCDNCAGSWKNYEGVKYHKTKAKVVCNPNWTRPPTPPPPEEKKKRKREDLAQNERLLEEAARITAQREEDGALQLSDGNGRPKRRAYRRRQAAEPKTPQKTVSYKEPSEHRARSILSDRIETPVAPKSPSVQATETGSPSKVSTPEKRAMLAAKTKLKYPTANGRDNIERRTGPLITQQRKEIIMDLIEANGGAFPGDQGLWFAMHAAWMRKYPNSLIQDYKYCNQAVGLLEDSGHVTKVKFSFRDEKGRMRTRAVIAKKGVDPLSQEVTAIKTSIKEVFPRYYCPPEFAPPESVLSMLEARESRPSEEERQRRMLEKEQQEDPIVRAEKEAEDLNQARILSSAVEGPKKTTQSRNSTSDNENEIALLSAPFYAPDPDAEGETDTDYKRYMKRQARKRRKTTSTQRLRSDSFREGQSSRMKALWASLRAQGVTLKRRYINSSAAMGEDESDSDFMLTDNELDDEANFDLKYVPGPKQQLFTVENQIQVDSAHHYGWQTAPSLLQNQDGSWGKGLPEQATMKIHIRKSVLPEPVTYMQSANNPAWDFRPYGHGVNAIHVKSANDVGYRQFSESFRPVVVHSAKYYKSKQNGSGRDQLSGRGEQLPNFVEGNMTKKSKSVRWDDGEEETDDQRPYGFTVTGEEISWPDFKPLSLPDSRMRSRPVMPEWSNNPGLDSLVLYAPSFGVLDKTASTGASATESNYIAATSAGIGASDGNKHIKGLFSRSTASFKDMLPKSLESIVSQMKAKVLLHEPKKYSAYADFMTKIALTAEWEQAIGGRTLLGMGSITPGQIYINHTAEEPKGPQAIKPDTSSWLADNSFTLETLPYELLVVDPVEQLLSRTSKRKHRRGYQKRQRTEQASSFFGMVEATKSDFDYVSRKRKLPGSQLIGQPRPKRPYRRAAQSKDFRVRRHTSLPVDIHGLELPTNDPDFHVSVSYHGISGHRKRTNERTVISEALDDRLIVAVVVIRTLTGGLDQSVDWVLVSRLFPQCTMNWVRRHFAVLAEKHSKRISNMTEDFQTAFLAAYEAGEVPSINYDRLLDYNWDTLINWTMARTQLVRTATVDLPSTREKFDELFELQDMEQKNWTDSYFSGVLPLHKRMAHASAGNMTLPVLPATNSMLGPLEDTLRIARSWARASTLTPLASFNPDVAAAKLRVLGAEVMRDAMQQLVERKVIMSINKGRVAPGRAFEITDALTAVLSKALTVSHYDEAVAYKAQLDDAFKRGEIVMLEYTANEGEILASTNLQAAQRTMHTGHRIPMNKFGLTEGNYQTKKMDKTKLLFDIQISPSDTYIYDDAHPLIVSDMLSIKNNPPPKPNDGALPLWYDINDQLMPGLWRKVIGAVLATIMQRPGIDAKEVSRLLNPALEEWEARLVIEWAFGVDAVKEVAPGTGIEGWTVGEWWWWVVGKI